MNVEVIALLSHPGDLPLGQWARLLGMFVAFIVLRIADYRFYIFKVVKSGRS